MNKKNVITIYLLLITIIVLFVPFQYSFNAKTIHRTEYYGYSFIFKAPVKMHEVTVTAKATNDDFSDVDELMSKFGYKPKKNVQIEPDNSWKTEIIYPRIGLELIAVSAICGILYLNVKSNE